MSPIQPRTPPGTLELLPAKQIVFQHMLDAIRRGYERFGFLPVETPVFEQRDVLLTKSGGETEKQVYFVQSTGGLAQGHAPELALRFDLTVPLARYVAEHERDLAFPFRRYQIQRVYRGERAQRGRFREFYQCDIDVIGKDKLDPAYDAEIPAIIVQVFEELGVGDFTIHFSNRKILRGVLNHCGVTETETQTLALREIDKLDKIGEEKVVQALETLGISKYNADFLLLIISCNDTNAGIISNLRSYGDQITDEIFHQGLRELAQVADALAALGVPEERTRLNLAIARGLDYYTGTVYETLIDAHPEFGSVCSGGRYDDLASHYTKSKLPGVGISIGLTRLFDQLDAHNLLPKVPHSVQVLVTQLDMSLAAEYLAIATELRRAGFTVENYLEPSKLEKQLKYADKSGIPFAIVMGTNERNKGTVQIKNLLANAQVEVARDAIAETLGTLSVT
jgi:histidyl-tRNA synthetase